MQVRAHTPVMGGGGRARWVVALVLALVATLSAGRTAMSAPPEHTWAFQANLSISRAYPAAATSHDGRVYVMGGERSVFGAQSSAEAFSPQSGTWAAIAPMPWAAAQFAAATADDGRIFVFPGDVSTFPPIGSIPGLHAAAYDPTTDSWTEVAPPPETTREATATTARDGRIYVIGGGAGHAAVDIYDPLSNSWSSGAPVPTPRFQTAAALGRDGRIYVMGGSDGSTALSTVEAYSPRTNSWTTVAPMPTPRVALAATATADGRIYAVGGRRVESFVALDTVEVYDPSRNAWSSAPGLNQIRYGLAAATSGPRIYAIGGKSGLSVFTVEGLFAMGAQ
jgi:N-acetylneuraminic acid mutarotase